MHRVLTGLIASVVMAMSAPVSAQEFPNKPVRIIVPFLPGAGNDVLGRLTAEHLSPRLGQPVTVENRAGAGSQIGVDFVAKSPPDGYTLLWAASDGISVLPAVKDNMPYKVPDDFTFVSRIVELPFALVVSSKLPINSVADLLAYAKANPGKLRYGTSGVGGVPHMGTVLMEKRAGIKLQHIPYRGVAAVVNDLLGGHVDIGFVTPPTIKPHAGSTDKIRIIATTGTKRHALFPDVPTLIEAGIPDAVITAWYGVLAPAKLPAPVLDRLTKDLRATLADQQVQQRLDQLGYTLSPLEGAPFRDFVVNDLKTWTALAKSENIKVEE